MSGPEDNPADDVPPDKDEWEEWERRQKEYADRIEEDDDSGPWYPGKLLRPSDGSELE